MTLVAVFSQPAFLTWEGCVTGLHFCTSGSSAPGQVLSAAERQGQGEMRHVHGKAAA